MDVYAIGEVASKAVIAALREAEKQELRVVAEPDEDVLEFLKDVEGAVEADSYASHQLWFECAADANKFGGQGNKTWEQGRSGTGRVVGTFAGHPVFVSLFKNVVDGKQILFYDATSVIVDHDMVREYIETAIGEAQGFKPDGRDFFTDAQNFHNILR